MADFKPYRVPVEEARAGDILLFKRSGSIAAVLSWLIWKIKEPKWNRWEWHGAPVVSDTEYMDAQFPRLKLARLSDIKGEVHCYRVFEKPPHPALVADFVKRLNCKPYDFLVYFPTALWALGIPVSRIINRFYDCWETFFAALECWGFDMDWTDLDYPFLTNFLRAVGELK